MRATTEIEDNKNVREQPSAAEITGGHSGGTPLEYFGGHATRGDRISRRVTLTGKSFRPRSRAAVQTGPRSPGQSSPSSTTLAFLPSTDNNVLGYSIYRSLTNDQKTGLRIGFISQPPDGQQVSITDNPQVAGTYFYWAAAVNASGAEGARIGLGSRVVTPVQATGNQSSYTITFSSTLVITLANGDVQSIVLTANVTSSSIAGTPVIGQRLTLRVIQDGTGGWTFPAPTASLAAFPVGPNPGDVTRFQMQYHSSGWEYEFAPYVQP